MNAGLDAALPISFALMRLGYAGGHICGGTSTPWSASALEFSPGPAFEMEPIFTFIPVYVATGSVVFVGAISEAAFNPAVGLAANRVLAWSSQRLDIVSAVRGGALAALATRALNAHHLD